MENLPLPFKTFRTVRYHMEKELNGLDDEMMLVIPDRREDNVLWNVGHLLCSLSRLSYVRSGHALPIPEHYLGLFGKNTDARSWETTPSVKEVLGHFREMPRLIESDYAAGKFTSYNPLELAPGHTINSIEEAISFHCFHEGLHLGMVISLKDLLNLTNSA